MAKSDLLDNLDQVTDWKMKKIQALDAQIEDATRKEERLESDLKTIQKNLEKVRERRLQVLEEKTRVSTEEKEHFQIGISKGLEEATKLIGARNEILQNLKKARENQVEQLLKQPKFQEKIAEYEQFQETEHELEKLPKSYQEAIRKHHEQVERELAPIFRALSEPLPSGKQTKRVFGLVAAIDPSFEKPEAMAVVVPVPFSTYTSPSSNAEELNQVIAYRMCAAISGALHRVGISNASIHYGEFKGCLSIQVWLEGQNISGDIKQAISLELERIRSRSSELKSVQLGIDIAWVDPEMLAGGEE